MQQAQSTWVVRLMDGTLFRRENPHGELPYSAVPREQIAWFGIVGASILWDTREAPLLYRRRTQITPGKGVVVCHVLVLSGRVVFVWEDGRVLDRKGFSRTNSWLNAVEPTNEVETAALKEAGLEPDR